MSYFKRDRLKMYHHSFFLFDEIVMYATLEDLLKKYLTAINKCFMLMLSLETFVIVHLILFNP